MSPQEMKSIGLIIGNLAFDGISARELLSTVILSSSFLDQVIDALTVDSSVDAVESALWALDNLLDEQAPRSHRALSKQVYGVVKQLSLVLSLRES